MAYRFAKFKTSLIFAPQLRKQGVLAHLVERDTGSVEVSGSSPLYSTNEEKCFRVLLFCFFYHP